MIVKESPLQRMKLGSNTSVSIKELAGLHTFDLRVQPDSPSQSALVKALGIDLPNRTGLISSANGIYSLCLAPDWWLIVGMYDAVQRVSLLVNDDYHFSLVDVSGQRTTIELEGPNARDVLAHYWEQDLRDKSFPVGSVSQGLMAKAPVVVSHIASQRYWVMVRSSFALHLWKSLEDAMVEWV